MDPEQQCIEFALLYKQQLLEDELREVSHWSDVEWPNLSDAWPEWKRTVKGKVLQVILLPLVVLFLSLEAVVTILLNFYEHRQRKKELKRELKSLLARSKPFSPPKARTLKALWTGYGLHERFGIDSQIYLMGRWIEILFGKETLQAFDLKGRSDEINARRLGANKAYYRRGPAAPHFHFIPVVDALAQELSKDLPSY